MTQRDLFVTRERTAEPVDLAHLLDVLAQESRWVSAQILHLEYGYSDRYLRTLAHASEGRIIGGPLGYRLTRLATTAEVNRAIHALERQAARMQARAKQVRAVLNGAQRGAA